MAITLNRTSLVQSDTDLNLSGSIRRACTSPHKMAEARSYLKHDVSGCTEIIRLYGEDNY